MKILFTILTYVVVGMWDVRAQSDLTSVKGTIQDEKNEPVAFANVLLLNESDSVLVTGVTSEADGHYLIDQVKAGNYLLMVSVVGYEKKYRPLRLEAGKQSDLSPIVLNAETQALKEVTVVAKKPFIEQQIDRTVVNVENSIVSAGATALEVLERSPGVTVDQQNERLKLRGKEGIIVQIDGKQSYLSEQELFDLLKNTPSDNIEKIELITNPSSKYDAAGNSGIINIKFKRNKNYGTNGNVTVGGGLTQRNLMRGNGSLSLNHREGKVSLFGTLNGFKGEGFNTNDITRSIPYEGKKTYFDQVSDMQWNAYNYSFRGGLDYFVTEKTTLGVMASGFKNGFSGPRSTGTEILGDNKELTRTYNTESLADNNLNNITANVNLKHQFDDKGKELTFDLDYVNYNRTGGILMDTRYFKPDGSIDGPDEIMRNTTPSDIHIGVAKIDYATPIGKGKLEIGAKSSLVTADNNMRFENQFDSKWELDSNRSNQFKYDENINAAYGNFSGQFNEKTKFQVGLRIEHTNSTGNSVTLDKMTKREYINLFPSVFLSRNLDSNNVVNLSYSHRIDRPNYQSLNPFEYYLDPYTFSRGNPLLRPQYTHSFQLVHVYKQFLNTTLAYSRTKNMIAGEVTYQIPEENKTYIMPDNLNNQDHVSLNISAPIPVAKWWSMQTNGTAIYMHYNTMYQEANYDLKAFSWNASLNNTFTIGKGWTAELSGWYNSPSVYDLFRARSMGMINAGVQKTMLDKKATLRLNVNDIFAMNSFRGETKFQDIDLTVRSTWPSRQARITFTYRFGNQHVKVRNRNTGSTDLQQRVGSGDN